MLVYPIEPKIYTEPFLPEEQLRFPLDGHEMREFVDTISSQAKQKGLTPGLQKLLEEYSHKLIENYINLPERDLMPEAYARYHLLVRTATFEALTNVFSLDKSVDDMEHYSDLLAHTYIERFHTDLAEIQTSAQRELLGSKIQHLLKLHYVNKSSESDACIDHALYSYMPSNKQNRETLLAAVSSALRILYLMNKYQVQNQVFDFPASTFALRQDVQTRNESNFTALLHAVLEMQSEKQIATLVLASNRLSGEEEIHALQTYLVGEASALHFGREYLGIILYIFHYQMKQDLTELISWYGKRLLDQQKYHV